MTVRLSGCAHCTLAFRAAQLNQVGRGCTASPTLVFPHLRFLVDINSLIARSRLRSCVRDPSLCLIRQRIWRRLWASSLLSLSRSAGYRAVCRRVLRYRLHPGAMWSPLKRYRRTLLVSETMTESRHAVGRRFGLTTSVPPVRRPRKHRRLL